jgi:hypothetical protein
MDENVYSSMERLAHYIKKTVQTHFQPIISVQTLYSDTVSINLLKTKRRPLYLKTQSVPRCKHFSSRL